MPPYSSPLYVGLVVQLQIQHTKFENIQFGYSEC